MSTLFMQVIAVHAVDYTCTDGEVVIFYSPDKGVAKVEGFTKVAENIVIPAKTDGFKVTEYVHVINHETDIIKTITLPKTIKKISRDHADCYFSGEQALEKLIIDSENSTYGCKNNIFYNKKTGRALECIGDFKRGKFTIPKYIKKIGKWAFNGPNITKLTVEKNLTEIGWGAFSYIENLEKVIIKGNVKVLSTGAFSNCKI